jgi:hypothetical protein
MRSQIINAKYNSYLDHFVCTNIVVLVTTLKNKTFAFNVIQADAAFNISLSFNLSSGFFAYLLPANNTAFRALLKSIFLVIFGPYFSEQIN